MASQDTSDLLHTLDSVVRGHHVYKRIWTHTVGDQLQLRPEEDNERDPRVLKHGVIVGHLPRKTARTVWFFLQRGGAGGCNVTRDRACGGKFFRTFNFVFRQAGNKLAIRNY